MSNTKPPDATSTDWTRLLTDPELVSHLGELLKAYREAAPEKREEALLAMLRQIKQKSNGKETGTDCKGGESGMPSAQALPVATASIPPFEPDIFTPSWGEDRRRFPRMKCFVAVELKMDGSEAPIWGNLSNTSMGGCFVETVTPVKPGVSVEIGLWVANGKIWVKGLVLTGTVTQSKPSFGVRVKFAGLEGPERESLRQFLKFVETTTKGYHVEHGYLAQLKK
jgi:hypothetical protein